MSAAIRAAPVFRAKPSYKFLTGLVGSGAVLYYLSNNNNKNHHNNNNNKHNFNAFKTVSPLLGGAFIINKAEVPQQGTFEEYQTIYNEIAEKMRTEDDADGGAGRFGLLTRLAWHASGTYDKADGSGGSYGGTMNFAPESTDGANAGLEYGRAFLMSIKEKHEWISFGDLWTLGGVAAIQEAGGPKIKWRPGRKDEEKPRIPPNGRLPDAAQGQDHVRTVFTRMGFNERETVALLGAHCLGKCHPSRSGYDGPWVPAFNVFTNDFYVKLLGNWHVRKWDGPKQYEDDESNSLMMLPADYSLREDSGFLKYVKMYAADQDLFFKDFSVAFAALLERGVEYPRFSRAFTFKTLDEQEE